MLLKCIKAAWNQNIALDDRFFILWTEIMFSEVCTSSMTLVAHGDATSFIRKRLCLLFNLTKSTSGAATRCSETRSKVQHGNSYNASRMY